MGPSEDITLSEERCYNLTCVTKVSHQLVYKIKLERVDIGQGIERLVMLSMGKGNSSYRSI